MLISQATHSSGASHLGIVTEQNVVDEKNVMDHDLMIKDVVEAEAEVANEEGIFS